MDRNMILDHLAMVRRHVARGEQIVARQREIIARLEPVATHPTPSDCSFSLRNCNRYTSRIAND
jgi:hypothetical protein